MLKKVILFILLSSLAMARTVSDLAVTVSKNKYDDPDFLRDWGTFYGIRLGIQQHESLGWHFGIERDTNANCKSLDLTRLYTQAQFFAKPMEGVVPYVLATVGFEMSSIDDHKPDQFFAGAGVGAQRMFDNRFGGFVEMRLLRKFESDDTDWVGTLGLYYRLSDTSDGQMTLSTSEYPELKSVRAHDRRYTRRVNPPKRMYKYRTRQQRSPNYYSGLKKGKYYIQVAMLTKADPIRYVRGLRKKGLHYFKVKRVRKNRKRYSLVLVGPFQSRESARSKLPKVRRYVSDAFVVRY